MWRNYRFKLCRLWRLTWHDGINTDVLMIDMSMFKHLNTITFIQSCMTCSSLVLPLTESIIANNQYLMWFGTKDTFKVVYSNSISAWATMPFIVPARKYAMQGFSFGSRLYCQGGISKDDTCVDDDVWGFNTGMAIVTSNFFRS